MTVDVGVIIGDLTITTTDLGDGHARVMVQYTGAEEWYELEGSPLPIPVGGIDDLHRAVLDAVQAGGGANAPS